MIIDFNDFKREGKIPNLFPEMGSMDELNLSTREQVQAFIDRYEIDFLLQFFGCEERVLELENYNDLGFSQKTDEAKNKLIESLKSIIPHYISFFWFRNETEQNTGIGAVIPQGENATRTNNIRRSVSVWNEMVKNTRKLHREHFRLGYFPDRDIFKTINGFGI